MKNFNYKSILLLIPFLFAVNTTQAQFLERLKKHAQEKIEREAERRTERRVDKGIDKVYDKTEDEIDGKSKKSKKKKKKKKSHKDSDNSINADESNSPDTPQYNNDIALASKYNFEWKYVLKVEQNQKKKKKDGDVLMTYYLSQNTTAFATKITMDEETPMENMLMLMDTDAGASLILMENEGEKTMLKMPMMFNEDDTDDELEEEYSIEKIDSKTILGYECQGFRITSSDGIIVMYFAKSTPVSFSKTFEKNSKFKPKGFDPRWMKEFENGMMMEMQFTSSKKKKYDMKITCVELKKESLSINLSEYNSMDMGE